MADTGTDVATVSKPSNSWYWLIFCGLTALLWLGTVRWPSPKTVAEDWDISWKLLLHHGFDSGWQWGKDFLFTFGPLGFLYSDNYFPDTINYTMVWMFGFQTLCLGLVVQVILEMRSWISRCCFVLLFLSLSFIANFWQRDAFYTVVLWVITCGYVASGSRSLIRVLLIAGVAVLLSLTKFTLLTWSAVVLTTLTIYLGQVRGWRAACVLAGGSLFMAVFAWLGSGQTLSLFPDYLISAREIARGYSTGMMFTGPAWELRQAAMIGAGMLLVLAVGLKCRQEKRPALFVAGISVLTLLLVWKHGFVRHDFHSSIFFAVVPCLAMGCYLGPEAGTRDVVWRSLHCLLVGMTVLLCLRGGIKSGKQSDPHLHARSFPRRTLKKLATNASNLLAIQNYLVKQESVWRKIQQQERERIPELVQRVGQEPVAWFMTSQFAPLASGIRLAPRGVPQSYSVYTSWLTRENAKPFQEASAPRFAVIAVEPIDNRWPLGEDSLALLQIFSNYRPVANYGRYLLFERNAAVARTEPFETDVVNQECKFGESIEVPRRTENWKVFAVDVSFSRMGKLINALYKAPEIRLQLDCWDGQTLDYRLIPGQCENWSLLDPLIVDNDSLTTLFTMRQHREVRRFRIHVADKYRDHFQEPLRVRVREYPAPLLAPVELQRPLTDPASLIQPVAHSSSKHEIQRRQ